MWEHILVLAQYVTSDRFLSAAIAVNAVDHSAILKPGLMIIYFVRSSSKKIIFILQRKPKPNDHSIKNISFYKRIFILCPLYIYYLVPFERTFISGTNMSWEKCKYLAEHKYRIKCTLHTQNTPSPKFQIASKYCTHTSFSHFFSSHTNNFFSQTCAKSVCNTNVNMIKKALN